MNSSYWGFSQRFEAKYNCKPDRDLKTLNQFCFGLCVMLEKAEEKVVALNIDNCLFEKKLIDIRDKLK